MKSWNLIVFLAIICKSESTKMSAITTSLLILLPYTVLSQNQQMRLNDNKLYTQNKNGRQYEIDPQHIVYYNEDDIQKLVKEQPYTPNDRREVARQGLSKQAVAVTPPPINTNQGSSYNGHNSATALPTNPNLGSSYNGKNLATPLPLNTNVGSVYNGQNLPNYNGPVRQANEGQAPIQNVQQNVPENIGAMSALTNFGLELLQAADQNQGGNVVVSPYSVAICLALLQQGAYGETQNQISNALHMPPQASAEAFQKLNDGVKNSRQYRNVLRLATNMFVSHDFSLKPGFKRTAIHNFDSDVTLISFKRPDVAAQIINNWVSAKTENKIDKLVTPDAVSENAQLVLVNAVYFKGLWQSMFNADLTSPAEFHKSNGVTKTVPFMRLRKPFKTAFDRNINSRIVVLPFEGDQYSLMLILPADRVNVNDVLRGLTEAQLAMYHKVRVREVQLEIPKFTIRNDMDLKPVLQKLGITNMFGSRSELFGIGDYGNFSAIVSSAKHSAVLSIDEKGGSAAAATSFAVVALSYEDPAIVFKANKPFLAILWNNDLQTPFFMAKIEDPTL